MKSVIMLFLVWLLDVEGLHVAHEPIPLCDQHFFMQSSIHHDRLNCCHHLSNWRMPALGQYLVSRQLVVSDVGPSRVCFQSISRKQRHFYAHLDNLQFNYPVNQSCKHFVAVIGHAWGMFSSLHQVVNWMGYSAANNLTLCVKTTRSAYMPSNNFTVEFGCTMWECYFIPWSRCPDRCFTDEEKISKSHFPPEPSMITLARRFKVQVAHFHSFMARWVYSQPLHIHQSFLPMTQALPRQYVSVHVRWGDKLSTFEATKKPLSVYAKMAAHMAKSLNTTNLYLSSTDSEARSQFPRVWPHPLYVSLAKVVLEGFTSGSGEQNALSILEDVHVMLGGSGVVVSFSSNIGRWCNEWSGRRINFKIVSVD
jgi:hypothetical protein